MAGFFDTKIEFLKGVGPQRAALLKNELNIHTYGDLIQHYPFRYEDRTRFHKVAEITDSMQYVQVRGYIRTFQLTGKPGKQRLIVIFYDDTGEIELLWFRGIKWILKKIQKSVPYILFGKPALFGGRLQISHPELEEDSGTTVHYSGLQPVYSTSEKLKEKFLNSKGISKLQKNLYQLSAECIKETLPENLRNMHALIDKPSAIKNIHFPETNEILQKARYRLKFEEFFFIQLRLLKSKINRFNKFRGLVLNDTGLLTDFYKNHMPFELTGAQKRVMKEIYSDFKSGHQMNRLLQGDVGSGKTMVAFLSMLLAIGNSSQAALMSPTEILAEQHFNSLRKYTDKLNLKIGLLTGSTKKSERKNLIEGIKTGDLNILVGTHALIEDNVEFKKMGLAVIDEQHRFGVAQRAKLWNKNIEVFPHVLVMTATPIPRTLAMTLYGDLDVSVLDEMPSGRKPIKTYVQFEGSRLKVFGFIKNQIAKGRQVYIVYPLIEESEKSDMKHLYDGYESIRRAFPEIPLSIVHGKQKSTDKEFEMQRFVRNETRIMVSTTVIEVGIDVPNASVMIIENAERFGLAQLHQLRGRVGRGADQSYCILMTTPKISKEARIRLETMVRTNNGFEIADIDLQLRGPGDLMGTQQSGILDLLIGDLGKDGKILQTARHAAREIIESDPELAHRENMPIIEHIRSLGKDVINWSRIS